MHRLAAMNLHISESWMREHQVLPDRTHPLMQMSGSSAFLLSGTRVHKKSDRPPSRNTAALQHSPGDGNEAQAPAAKKAKV